MDIQKYKTVREFYEDAKQQNYSVPLCMCAELSKLMNARGLNFQQAYNFLCEKEFIILAGKTYIYNLAADNL
ncbi:MAG: hypothetical protein ABSA74_01040 [Candidatus Staskawiczbacteria bacterium]|jgi:hypothetical protein